MYKNLLINIVGFWILVIFVFNKVDQMNEVIERRLNQYGVSLNQVNKTNVGMVSQNRMYFKNNDLIIKNINKEKVTVTVSVKTKSNYSVLNNIKIGENETIKISGYGEKPKIINAYKAENNRFSQVNIVKEQGQSEKWIIN